MSYGKYQAQAARGSSGVTCSGRCIVVLVIVIAVIVILSVTGNMFFLP